jgi:hypothetical protein
MALPTSAADAGRLIWPPEWPEADYNIQPLPDDRLLPLPCAGAMAFRVVAVGPEPRTLDDGLPDGPLRLGPDGAGAYLLGKYEVSRQQAAALAAFAEGSGACPPSGQPDRRQPRAEIAWGFPAF